MLKTIKKTIALALLILNHYANGQTILSADGPGDTYELITSIFAPGQNPIEVPDCNHESFGDHIDEIFDEELDAYVFRFHIHTTPDDDRCINFDRQRNEIKTYSPSPAHLKGVEGERVRYTWKFKLAEGFQSSPNFTHIHQLKSVGGSLASMPMYTLTTRKGTPDRIELRYAATNNQVTLTQTELAPFIDTWLEVSETIDYGSSGSYEIIIKRVSNDEIMLEYFNESLTHWRPGADFVRPKWGIYRSLLNVQDLRDEMVLFADLGIEELTPLNSSVLASESAFPNFFVNGNTLYTETTPQDFGHLKIYSLQGRCVLSSPLTETNSSWDISDLEQGIYVLTISDKADFRAKQFFVD